MFDDFKRYVGSHDLPNDFYPVSEEDIIAAETSLGYRLPDQLKQFYREVGCGFYAVGKQDPGPNPAITNRIMPPREIPDVLTDENYPYRPYEGFTEGTMPFFDCGSGTFLVVKPLSNNPNTVYWPGGLDSAKVTDDLVEFFRRLYEHADFYRADVRKGLPNS